MKGHANIKVTSGAILIVCLFVGIIRAAELENARAPVRLRIVDSVTGVLVPRASVSIRPSGRSDLVSVGIATNGFLKFNPPTDDRMLELYVEAADFKTHSELARVADKNEDIQIRLDPDRRVLKGTVLAPNGFSTSNAKLVLTRPEKHVQLTHLGKGEVWDINDFGAHSERDGSFAIDAEPGAQSILVVHPLGSASVSLEGWTNGTQIHLRPWTVLRGRMIINGKPAANRTLAASGCTFFRSHARVFLDRLQANTDAEGRFFFDQLPPGEIEVALLIPLGGTRTAYSHWASFVSDPALAGPEAVYDLQGRDVSGRLKFDDAQLRWGLADAITILVGQRKELMNEFTMFDGGAKSWTSPSYALVVDNEAVFSGLAIPPGEYQLNMHFHGGGNGVQIFRNSITIPPGNGPVDLGTITVTNAARGW